MVRHSVDFPEKIRPTDTNSLFDSGQVSIWTFTHCIYLDLLPNFVYKVDDESFEDDFMEFLEDFGNLH